MRTHLAVLSFAVLAGCATQQPAQQQTPPPAQQGPTPEQQAEQDAANKYKAEMEARAKLPMPPGLDEAAMDASADPCSDFYQYACGGWVKTTEIPADRPLYTRGFVAILERNELVEKQILEDAVAGKLKDEPYAKQLSDFYSTCMDEPKLEKGLAEVQKFASKYNAPKNPKDVAKVVGELHAKGAPVLFDFGAMQDLKNSNEVIAGLDQGGLGLPDRDYYLDEKDPKKVAARQAYQPYIEQMLTFWGEPAAMAKGDAAQVMELETALAKASMARVDRRDPDKIYHRLDRKGLKTLAPDFDWDAYFTAVGGKSIDAININSEDFFKEVARLAKETKPAAWKAYLTWVLIRSSVPALPKKFQDASFAFQSANFTGAKEDRPRWKKCVGFADHALGEALGHEFVRRTFGEDGKARTSAMVQAIQASLKQDLETLKWMDPPTRAEALKKMERMVGNNKIGFPDVWRDYSKVKTDKNSFFANSIATGTFEADRQLKKVGQPPDRKEWVMSPPTVNAYNEGQKNEIVFPAGILQPPFFNRDATDAVNIGSMGMVVGHEITHGFDDQGRKFDVDGNRRDWWTPEVAKQFVEKADCVKRQYDGYVAVDDLHVNGGLTLGENVADLGGLKLSYAALAAWYAKKGDNSDDTKYRFSAAQQLYLGFAQSWCSKVRPEQARLRVQIDPHAPPYWRVDGPLGNLDGFSTAWHCPKNAKMVRTADRCEVW